jgi:hypothetical protein
MTSPRQSALEAVAKAADRLGDTMNECSDCDAEFKALWAALDALDALGPADTDDGWRPIDTVPDGEHVLLWFPDGERGIGGIEAATVFHKDDGSLDHHGWTHGGPNSGSDWEFCEQPTRWRPLPAPPQRAQEGADPT